MVDKLNNDEVFECIGEKRTLINNFLYIVRKSCLLHAAIEGQMSEMKGVDRRKTELIDNLRN
jgi:hypothetical protein